MRGAVPAAAAAAAAAAGPMRGGRRSQGAGMPAVGGPFELTSSTGERVSSEQLKGDWVLLSADGGRRRRPAGHPWRCCRYFGFTFCPDICPDELDKMTEALEILETTPGLPTAGGAAAAHAAAAR